MNYIEHLETPVKKECDVLVLGGGIAGISAALSAARQKKKVLLIERSFILGGLATSGLVTIYLPLCDGNGHQVSFGIAEELLRLSLEHYDDHQYGSDNWIHQNDPQNRTSKDPRFEVSFNPQLYAISCEQLLTREGVEILYGTYAVQTIHSEDSIEALIVENKSGRFAIQAKSFVDASGDADIAHFSGTPTKVFGQGNVLAGWYYSSVNGDYKLHMVGFCDLSEEDKANGQVPPETLVKERYTGLDGDEISRLTQLSHFFTLNDILKKQKENPEYIPATIATIPQLRMTRRVDGAYTQDTSEQHQYFEDSIGMVSDWRKRGPVYEVPFRCLYSHKTKNLFFCGRTTSCTDNMWDIMRVIPCCAVTGEAAGLAAAMTSDVTTFDVHLLQAKLKEQHVVLHEQDL